MNKRFTQSLMATIAAAVLLSGCGQSVAGPGLATQGLTGLDASATKTLLAAFNQIHMAAFTKLDANKDNQIDEYEASPQIALKDFTKVDQNHNGKLTKKEFMDYATGGSLFGFMRQDKNDFMRQARSALAKSFKQFDKDRDGLLVRDEMNNEALKKAGVNLTIDGLKIRVVIQEFDMDIFEKSDHTGDKALGQAEFEDYCMTSFITMINPDYSPNPAPAPVPSTEPTAAPPAEDPQPEPQG